MKEYTFKIPLVPESVNGLYKINYAHRCIYMSDEGRAFKYLAKTFIPKMDIKDDVLIGASAEYHRDWYYKNGKLKRADSPNLDKLLIDTLFESLGCDDSHLFEWSSRKVQCKAERFTQVTVRVIGTAMEGVCTHTT